MSVTESEGTVWFESGWRAAGEAIAKLHEPDGFARQVCRTCDQVWPCSTLQAVGYGSRAGYWLSGERLATAADACATVTSEFEGVRGWIPVVEQARALEADLRIAMKMEGAQ